ncbi:MAG: DUF1194 domain-containing protein [Paracoccaceae bacterium]
MGKYGKYRPLVRLIVVLLALSPASASAACRQALAIGLDISGSVDASEYRLQIDGLASALLDRDVQDAFLAMPDAHVRLYIYEWGGYGTQRPLIEWIAVTDAAVLNLIANRLLATVRRPHEPATALGRAMQYGGVALAAQGDCWRLTMDLSGDGESNTGPQPSDVRDAQSLANITINALVIGADAAPFTDKRNSEIAELTAYFKAKVIRGPEAFVEAAIEFEEFQDAMSRKLLKELQTMAVGALELPDQ